MSFLNDIEKVSNILSRPLTDEELNEFFLFNQTKQFYKVWIMTERFEPTIKVLKLFASILDNLELLRNVYSCIPKDERDREELKKSDISYIDAYDMYYRTQMPFLTLWDCLIEIFHKEESHFWDLQHIHAYNVNWFNGNRSVVDLLNHYEIPNIWGKLEEVEKLITFPISLRLDGVPYTYINPDYKAGYEINNKADKYKHTKVHFRTAKTKSVPYQDIGAELVWNDTGKQVNEFKDKWLDKEAAESLKDLGRYEGNPYWGPYAPSGFSRYCVDQDK